MKNDTLLIISIQHALAMSIGKELRLRPMLQTFIQAAIKQLSLKSAHIFLFTDQHHRPISIKYSLKAEYLDHYISMPSRIQGKLWQDETQLAELVECFSREPSDYRTEILNNKTIDLFHIPNHGVIVFEASNGIDTTIKQALLPILQKLSFSCYGALVHDSLLKEITTRQQVEARINHQIEHDDLTQLCNRRQFNRLLEQELSRAKRRSIFGSVVYIDINQFKSINDTVGHDIGDQLLVSVAKRLKNVIRREDTLARFGGDEFIVMLTELGSDYKHAIDKTQSVIFEINKLFESPFTAGNAPYQISCTMGFNIFPHDHETWVDIIKHSDIAMHEAKQTKAKYGLLYIPEMSQSLQNKLCYFDELKFAIEHNEFELYYQPQCDELGNIIGAEALLRWHNPRRGVESPAVYIPIAEESDLIINIGTWVLQEACRHIKQIQSMELPKTFEKLSINVSAKQFSQGNFKHLVKKSIAETGISPSLLGIEITENLLINQIHETIELITELKAMGITCSIDDFGTGYSSLTYLKRIPVEMIKIDREFVTNLHNDSEARSIAQLIISLGKTLGREILAEGVETKEELECLINLGCYKFQGYYFAKPMPFNEFIERLSISVNQPKLN